MFREPFLSHGRLADKRGLQFRMFGSVLIR